MCAELLYLSISSNARLFGSLGELCFLPGETKLKLMSILHIFSSHGGVLWSFGAATITSSLCAKYASVLV